MLGLVLAGGGARGAFQAGAIRALLDNGYIFDGVAGTSVGALNGVMVAQGEFERSIELWHNMEFSKLFDIEDEYIERFLDKKLDKEALKYFYSKFRDVIANRGIDTTKIQQLIRDHINEEKVRRAKTDFGLVTFSVSDRKAFEVFKEEIPKGQLADYIMASANFPGFKKIVIDDRAFIDGGIYDNLPINMLAQKGYKDIIAITTGGAGIVARKRKVKDKTVNVTYINPSRKTGNTLNFRNQSVQRSLNTGYLDAMKMLKNYKGDRVYIDGLEYDEFERELIAMPRGFYAELCKIFEIPCFQSNMVNLVGISGKLSKVCKAKKFEYIGEIFVALCEEAAINCGVECLEVMTLKQLIKKTVEAYMKKTRESKAKTSQLFECFMIFAKYYK